ncbi:MAG: hypothetical protein EZS28_004114 [Streblomastix strix]|uniref:SPRY domain-containing protein n=1 Tax=Streblomastix strix TaxID=222440 RepID=A0A5J4WZ32_9EUKA|nr:MAG: hypothetical protein EZS28_004114 [Streblomastix strix]
MQILDDGIWQLEAIFDIYYANGCFGVGIVRDSYIYRIPVGAHPKDPPNNQHMAVYYGSYKEGKVGYKGNEYIGNT